VERANRKKLFEDGKNKPIVNFRHVPIVGGEWIEDPLGAKKKRKQDAEEKEPEEAKTPEDKQSRKRTKLDLPLRPKQT
jgi:hypothetical protein